MLRYPACKWCDSTWKITRHSLTWLTLPSITTEPACPDSQCNASSEDAVCAACAIFCIINGQCLHRYIPPINNQIAKTKLTCHNSLCTKGVFSLSATKKTPAFLLKANDLEFCPKDIITQNSFCSTDRNILSNIECYYMFCNSKAK